MSHALKGLVAKHKEFAEEVGLDLVAEEESPEFGGSACLKYSNGVVSLMVTKSREGISYYCADGEWRGDNWYSMDIIWNHLRQNVEYRKMKSVGHFSFLKDNFSQIVAIFQPSKKEQTASGLHNLELSRSKKLCG